MATVGNRGRFSERLKRISLFKRKRINREIGLEDSKKIYSNFLKVVAAIPGLVYGSMTNNEVNHKKNNVSRESSSLINDDVIGNCQPFLDENRSNLEKNNNKKIINDIDVENIIKRRSVGLEKEDNNYTFKDFRRNIFNDKTNINELERSIINLIKKELIKTVNELEILQSELYILSEVNGDNVTLKECQYELDKVKDMICKIDKMKEQYDFLKDNYDFEYLLEIDNNDLVDKIIKLRDECGNAELKSVSEDYKLLDTYKFLYMKIDDLKDKTIIFEEKKKEEELKLKQRDIDFEKLKIDVYNVDNTCKNYDNFVLTQNNLLKEIDNNVNKINSFERVDVHLRGFNQLFKNSFKYFGLLMISPLKGIIPSIATETLITRNIVKNLYSNLQYEETKKTIYEAIDYSNIINNAINNLDGTIDIVDATLEDIVRLKMKYNDNFRKYHGDFLEYRDIMNKINDMENKILGNKIKIEMMKKKALEQQRANDKKLVLVKKLNE